MIIIRNSTTRIQSKQFTQLSCSCHAKTHLLHADFRLGTTPRPPPYRGGAGIISHNEFSISPHFCIICFSLFFVIRLEFVKTKSEALHTHVHVTRPLPLQLQPLLLLQLQLQSRSRVGGLASDLFTTM